MLFIICNKNAISLIRQDVISLTLHHMSYILHNAIDVVNMVLIQLDNYKSVIKNVKSCPVVKHFIDYCSDTENQSKYLKFILIDCRTNFEDRNNYQIDYLLLEKNNFYIGKLCMIHKGLDDYHDVRRIKRKQNFKNVLANSID